MKCKLETCNNEVSKKARSYCCIECSKKGQVISRSLVMDSIREKQRQTNLKRYGVENPAQSVSLREKYKKTNLERYGSENPLSNKNIIEKYKKTNLERYGVENPSSNSEIKRKIKDTNIEKYGTEFASKLDSVKEKTKITNRKKYNRDYHTQSHISLEILEKCNDAEWLRIIHQDKLQPICQIADQLGISKSQLGKIYQKNNIDIFSFNKSLAELEVLKYIQSILDSTTISGTRHIIGGKELDIFLPEYNLAIEYNGLYWHSEISGKKYKNYHIDKTNRCKDNSIDLLHIFEHEWKYKTDIIKSIIKSKLNLLNKLPARKCYLANVSIEEEKLFLDKNHLQGYTPSSVCYGLYYENELVSLMSFGQPRYNKKYEYELIRFCNKLDFSVIGGSSKLFKHFIKTHSAENIISYSHRDKFSGNLYKNLGFSHSHSSLPSYFYTKNYEILESRLKYQKHRLSKLLEKYDPNLSEWDNMKNNGYDRIWDCGNDVWQWNITKR